MQTRTNLLTGQFVTSKVGIAFLFITVIGLAVAIIGAGSLAFIDHSRQQAKLESQKNALRASKIEAVTSNEKANPGTIAFYLNDTFAGALTDDGAYSPAEQPPPEGPLAILFVNPTDTPLPTTAEFPPQTLQLTSDTGAVSICLPSVSGGRTVWVSKTGSTYFDQFLTQTARNC